MRPAWGRQGGGAMKLSDFDFELPPERIATRPVRPRSASRLLVATPERLEDARFADLGRYLRPGDMLVLNDTRVIPARLSGIRRRAGSPGARIEATLLAPLPDGRWQALVRPLKKLRPGETIVFSDRLRARLEARGEGGQATLAFNLRGAAFEAALDETGAMPLPPYIAARRPADVRDREDYQPVWARRSGAGAAPTASLHFDRPLLARLERQGVHLAHVTLHVGAGTFLPVKVEDIARHRMHAERGEITEAAAAAINAARAAGGRIIPVGTTALRLLETAADPGGLLRPWHGETDIFITPGYRFRATDGLITNFHLPKSTLLMLVSALMGLARIRQIYAHAIDAGYRFFSYGDASLLLPGDR